MCFHQKKTQFSGSMLIYWRVIDILPRKCQKLGRPPCDRTWFHGTASFHVKGAERRDELQLIWPKLAILWDLSY